MAVALRPLFRATLGYEAASTGRRLASWRATQEGVNSLIFGSGDILRSRSRDIVRKNAWAGNAVAKWASNAVGSGIKPQSKHPDPEIKRQIQDLWNRWVDEADAAGLTDFYGLQRLACQSMIEGGEVLARLRPRLAQDGLSVPLQVQLLEAEHLPLYKNQQLDSGNWVRAGVEFNQIGQRVAYWIHKNHPGDRLIFQSELDITRVPADSVVHMFLPIRPGQLRGEPWLTRALVKLYNLDQWDDATLERQKQAAMFVGFVTENNPEDPVIPGASSTVNSNTSAPAGTEFAPLEPGTLQKLLPGESITFPDLPSTGDYGPFNEMQLRWVAAALYMMYEQLTGDLSRLNYSSIRAGLLEFRRMCEQVQDHVLAFQFCRPIWNAWMDQAVLSGALTLPGYTKDPRSYQAVEWRMPKWQWVDPLKDSQAEREAIRAGLKSLPAAVNEQGYDFEQVMEEIAAGNKVIDELGLILDSDPRKTAVRGAVPVSPGGGGDQSEGSAAQGENQ
jgi:lambda family phage portal protein